MGGFVLDEGYKTTLAVFKVSRSDPLSSSQQLMTLVLRGAWIS